MERPELPAHVTPIIEDVITSLDVWHAKLPVNSVRDHGIGAVSDNIDIVVVKLTTSSGAVGYGEASPWSVFTGTAEASFAAIDRYMRPHIIGRHLSNWRSILLECRDCVAHCTEAKAALETALYDVIGHCSGLSVAMLLGGAVKTKIPLSCSLANPDFDADIALCRRLSQDNVTMVKLKAGFATHAFDMMRLERLAKEFPDFRVRVDFNQGLHPDEALMRVRDVASMQPDFIEQPVKAPLFSLMAEIRQAIDIPLLADESVFNMHDLLRAIDQKICDGISIKIMKTGSLSASCQLSEVAAAAGLVCYGGDMFETGLAHMAGVHMIAAAPHITLGCEFYQAKYYLETDILEQPFLIEDGHVLVPDAPGLGVVVDENKVHHYSINHSSN